MPACVAGIHQQDELLSSLLKIGKGCCALCCGNRLTVHPTILLMYVEYNVIQNLCKHTRLQNTRLTMLKCSSIRASKLNEGNRYSQTLYIVSSIVPDMRQAVRNCHPLSLVPLLEMLTVATLESVTEWNSSASIM